MLEARIGSTASPPGRSFDLMKVGIGPIRAGIGNVADGNHDRAGLLAATFVSQAHGKERDGG